MRERERERKKVGLGSHRNIDVKDILVNITYKKKTRINAFHNKGS